MKRFTLSLSMIFVAIALTSNVATAQQPQQVMLQFNNQTSRLATVSWMNGSTPVNYKTVAPGQSIVVYSYVGTNWMIGNGIESTGGPARQDNRAFTLKQTAVYPQPQIAGYPPAAPQGSSQSATSSVNQAVVNFAKSKAGQYIPGDHNGYQCTDLAIAALRAAGARANNGYVWGRKISFDQLQPGDIIQMQSVRFKMPNGAQQFSYGPHTAIVTSVSGTKIQVMEQNIDSSPVQAGTYDVRYQTGGTMTYYRPVAANAGQAGAQNHRSLPQGGAAQPHRPQPSLNRVLGSLLGELVGGF